MSSSDLHELLASGQGHMLLGTPQGIITGRPSNSGSYQRDSNSEIPGGNDAKPSSVSTFQSLIKKWEEEKSGSNYDPTEFLIEMAEILEKVNMLIHLLISMISGFSRKYPYFQINI